jgi:hypothetical protein
MMRRNLIAILSILSCWFSGQLMAQVAGAKAVLDSNLITIGDQVKLELQLTVPAHSEIQWPSFPDTLSSHIDIIEKSRIDTLGKDPEKTVLRQVLKITSFDSGYWYVPPIPFRFRSAGDTTTFYLESKPVGLDVRVPKTDLRKDIKPIKPPLRAPITFIEMLPWLIGLILLAVIVVGAVYVYRRRKMARPILQLRTKPKLPPHLVALEALENLRVKKLWQSGRIKDYFTEMTDIIRVYIEGRFGILAMEMTTDEIMQSLKKSEADSAARNTLRETLEVADLVKFAKALPLPLENEQCLNRCVDFIKLTKPAAEASVAVEEDKVPLIVAETKEER